MSIATYTCIIAGNEISGALTISSRCASIPINYEDSGPQKIDIASCEPVDIATAVKAAGALQTRRFNAMGVASAITALHGQRTSNGLPTVTRSSHDALR